MAKRRILEDRGALPTEDGDLICGYQAMHEENFLSSCLREDVEGKEEEERWKQEEEAKEEERKCGKRGVEEEKREGVEMVSERICFDSSEEESVGNSCGFSWCVLASPPVVPDVTVPFSSVNVMCETVSSDSDC